MKNKNLRDETNYDWSKFLITSIQNIRIKKLDSRDRTKVRVKDLSKGTGFIKEEHKNQLIFTAHDVNLISLDELSQDEIWFIEKNKNGESCLKPFSDYTLNDDTKSGYSTIKSYLAGRFGAVPVIRGGDFNGIS